MSRQRDAVYVLNAKGADGIGTPRYVGDADHIGITLDSASSANMVIKFQGSMQKEMPDFAAAQSASNMWDYIEVKDLEDGSAIDGDTGVTLSGSDDHRKFEYNASGLTWVCMIVSSWSAGTVTTRIFVKQTDN